MAASDCQLILGSWAPESLLSAFSLNCPLAQNMFVKLGFYLSIGRLDNENVRRTNAVAVRKPNLV